MITAWLEGDHAAVEQLIDRHDRLVRFTIYRAAQTRCLQDPQWIDAIASATWEGFVRTVRRSGRPPRSLAALLVRIARNQVVNSLRQEGGQPRATGGPDDVAHRAAEDAGDTDTPDALFEQVEALQAVRDCRDRLDPADLDLLAQLPAILDRRWREAGVALGVPESTVRSRWNRVLQRLRRCLEEKNVDFLAPGDAPSDL